MLKDDANGDFYEVSNSDPLGPRTYLGEILGDRSPKKFILAAPGNNYSPDPITYAADATIKN